MLNGSIFYAQLMIPIQVRSHRMKKEITPAASVGFSKLTNSCLTDYTSERLVIKMTFGCNLSS